MLVFLCFAERLHSQILYTAADTLRGALRPERTAFDVVHYDLNLDLQPADSSLSGTVAVTYRGVFAAPVIQLDLVKALGIRQITQGGQNLQYQRRENAVFVQLAQPVVAGQLDTVIVSYGGKPAFAKRAPWDGGLTWTVDSLGRTWAAVSCEGLGASVWWPTKDHLSDEPDSVRFSMSVPNPLRVVSNGKLLRRKSEGNRTRYTYATSYPINNYNVTFYAGHYLNFSDTLLSPDRDTPLELRYSVIDYNLNRAKRHFEQVKPMLRCYESLLGPYPFWRDGYALIEAPYLGMEHQSAIAYGNNYMRGYQGGMIPADMDWDYLIIHESGHEYFGNALSVEDHGEMWLHESFTTYLEALYVECRYGANDYQRYLNGQLNFIANREPILQTTGVNYTEFPNSDHYFKGSWVIHTFRKQVGDEAFFKFLQEFYDAHAIGAVTTQDWLDAVVQQFGTAYSAFWRQYLTEAAIPRLVVKPVTAAGLRSTVAYFEDVIPGFKMKVRLADKSYLITDAVQQFDLSLSDWEQLKQEEYLMQVEGL